jgi:hypothetical protein
MKLGTGFYLVDHRLIAVAMAALLAVAAVTADQEHGDQMRE